MLNWIKISGIILITGIAGCTDDPEDDLKLPVRTEVTLGFLGEYPGGPGTSGINEEGNQFELTGCTVGIQRIEFEGIREAGDNVIFETDPAMNLPVIEFNGCHSYIPELGYGEPPHFVFDGCWESISEIELPQGVYKYIRIDIYLSDISNGNVSGNVEVDPLNSGILITGNFIHHWPWNSEEWWILDKITSYRIVFAIDSGEKFIFRSMWEAVFKQPERDIFLALDIMGAFDRISYKSIQEAEITENGEFQEIIISSKTNKDLYEILLYRLGLTTRMDI